MRPMTRFERRVFRWRKLGIVALAATVQGAPLTAFAQGTDGGQPAGPQSPQSPQSAPPAAAPQGAPSGTTPGTPSWMSPRLEEARNRYSRGLKLYEEGNTIAARVEFERAYELAPSYRILFNIGLCYKKANDYVEALHAFERYLSDGGDEVPEERKAAVRKEIAELRPNIATVTITTNVPGATVTVDDVPVGTTPIPNKVLVNPGRRKISASKTGMLPATKSVVFAGSDVEAVSLELVELPKSQQVTELEPAKPAWIPISITAGLAVGAGVVGILALKANSDQNDTVHRLGATRSEIDDAHSKTKSLSLAADILTGAAVVMGGVSLYLSLHRNERTGAQTSARLTPGGASIVGQF